MALKPLQILISAKDEASGAMDKLGGKAKAVAAAVLGYFSIKAFAGMVQGAAEFEAQLSRVQAATGATADEMDALTAAAQNAADGTKFSSVETAQALENLAKAGLSAHDAIQALPAVMSLAQAGDLQLGESAEYVTKAVMGLGLAFEDAGRVADVLALGANATNTSVQGLAQALSYAAPVANSLGVSLESTVAIIGKFADAGIDASRAGTALNAILSQFADPASTFRRELAAAGITTTNFEQALHQLAAAGPAGSRAINAVGTEAGPALRALLNQGMGALDELTGKLKNAEGSAAATAATMKDNLTGAWDGLTGAWRRVTDALTTPVLPVIKESVQQLSAAFSAAVKDGTIGRFGEAIAAAFQSGTKWARDFLAQVDFKALTANLQDFATRAGEAFTKVGEYASAAGHSAKLAYGVMSAGANSVMAVVYKIAEAFAGVASNIMSGIALLNEGLAKVTFGEMSEGFRREAEAVREIAGGLGAVSEEFARKSTEAFDGATRGANIAREGFAGLAGAVDQVSSASGAGAAAVGAMATQLQAAAEANAVATDKARAAAAATAEQAQKAEAARQAHEALRAEYAQAIATGDVQRAAELMQQLRTATDGAAASAKENKRAQEESAAATAAAFERMGIQTKEALNVMAATARQDFELVKASGQATSEGLQAAWKKAAEAAIEAGNGIAPAWVQSEAAAQKYKVVVDDAGKATLQLAQSGDFGSLVGGLNKATSAANDYAKSIAAAVAQQKTLGVVGSNSDNIKSTQVSGETRSAGTDLGTRTGIAAFLKAAGVDDDAVARRIASEFADEKGDVIWENNPGQLKYGGDGSTLSMALNKAAESYTFGAAGGAAQTPSTIPQPESTRTVNVNLVARGQSYGTVRTDAAGADAIVAALEAAARDGGG